MSRVFISQPMGGKTNLEIKKERRELVKELNKQGLEVLNTILDLGDNATSLQYLAKSIEIMDSADIVLFMPDWEKARGCVIEHEVALRYGKFVKEL